MTSSPIGQEKTALVFVVPKSVPSQGETEAEIDGVREKVNDCNPTDKSF
jgi:hypothetical protein